MDFTDNMIREVLAALHQEGLAQVQADVVALDLDDVIDELTPRPAGRHFRDENEVTLTEAVVLPSADQSAAERRLAEMQELSQDNELHVLTRDYIVAVTNQVVHKLERAG